MYCAAGYGKVQAGLSKAADLKLRPLVERLLSGGLAGRPLRHSQDPGNPGRLLVRREDFYEWLAAVDVLGGTAPEALGDGAGAFAGVID